MSPAVEYLRLAAQVQRLPVGMRRQYRPLLADLLRQLRAQITAHRCRGVALSRVVSPVAPGQRGVTGPRRALPARRRRHTTRHDITTVTRGGS